MGPTKTRRETTHDESLELDHLYQTAPVGLCLLDRNLRYLRINERLAEIHGKSVSEHLGRSVREVLPALAPVLEPMHKRILETGQPMMDINVHGTTPAEPDVEKDWLASYYPLFSNDGTVVGISVVVQDMTGRKRAAEEARTTQKMLSEAECLANAGSFQWDIAANKVTWSDGLYHIYGLKPQEFDASFEAFLNQVHPDSREIVRQTIETAYRDCKPFQMEERIVRPDGEIRVLFSKGEVITNEQGTPVRMVGSCQDITERKQAEGALRESTAALRHSHAKIQHLAGKLIAAQEEERKRVARELHDDVNQKLAALAITLSKMKQGLDPSEGVHDQVTELQRRTTELTDDVRRLSHRLHPATMEHVGLFAALRSYCAEFSSNAGIPIQMNLPDDLRPVSPDVALCLYRLTQESLQNISKHSGAREACVTLTEADGELRLLVSDTGVGFDVQGEKAKRGLGLVSMEERVRLVGGTLLLRSSPGTGTELEARVPAFPAEELA